MDVEETKSIVSNEEGQAIFEFIVFVPFYVYLLTVLISYGNSLNASINQNKILRGYYYRVAAGDSRLPFRQDLQQYEESGISTVGMAVIGYREKEGTSKESFAPCVKVLRYMGADGASETCEEVDTSNNQTHFVRIYTAYGICGESWITDSQGYYGRDHYRVSGNSCIIRSE